MKELYIVGLDLAKNVFQAHGADKSGKPIFSKKLSRAKLLPFLESLPPTVVAMEACATAHYWAREINRLGHEAKLVPPVYVKPFVKRQKNDAVDAEAIAEAASRATMRFVAVKSSEQQGGCMAFKTRDLFVRQRTQTINALRAHLAEHGLLAAKGIVHLKALRELLQTKGQDLPETVESYSHMLLDQIVSLQEKINELLKAINRTTEKEEVATRLMAVPGIGPITASAILAFAPPPEIFTKGRDFSAWLGLTPKQFSSGGKERLGRTSKMGQRDIRRLLITGAMAVVRWAKLRGAREGAWLQRMLDRKPSMLVAVALANKMARIVWALLQTKESYRETAIG
ncbi:IS110 family RNA-guided transposase [Flexibacterium corallicola]|uniref:IS110 family transposase n=1 Tax=Flexibacterium corallicola TaxID=3037259 RepID=UPI00286F9398|nr:IS110 family transposase [Pseudovibrio sp. M1P-2-3]